MIREMRRRLAASNSFTLCAALAILLAGCVGRTLSRPAIIGASASSGVGAEILPLNSASEHGFPDSADPADAIHVDIESVLNAAITRGGMRPIMLADPSFYLEPEKVGAEQIAAAADRRASLVIGLDALFWSVYGTRFEPAAGVDSFAARSASLSAACARLESIDAPMLLGDLPDMSSAAGKAIPESWIPPSEQLVQLNEQLQVWAGTRPNVVLVPVSDLVLRMREGEDLLSNGRTVDSDRDASALLLQKDQLHPTAKGLAVLLIAGLDELSRRGLIDRSEYVANVDELLSALPREAQRVRSSRHSGPLAMLGLVGTYKAWMKAAEAKDCERAAKLGERVFSEASRIAESPHELAGTAAFFTLYSYRVYCPDAPQQFRRWREQLTPKIRAARPDPWPLALWSALNSELQEEGRTLDRLIELQRSLGSLPPAYAEVVGDTYDNLVRVEPARTMELLPVIEPTLAKYKRLTESQARLAAVAYGDEKLQRTFETTTEKELERTQDPVLRATLEQRLREIRDPKVRLESQLIGMGVYYAELEWACEQAGRPKDAAKVRESAEKAIEARRYAQSKIVFERQMEAIRSAKVSAP